MPSVVVDTYLACERLPLVGGWLRRGRTEAVAAVTAVVEAILDQIDLTALVRERVDLDAIVAQVDVDAIAARVDVDKIVARIDLVGLADDVIEGVDLPQIIRSSTTSVTADVMTDVRSQGERADDFVSGLVDRMLGRNQEPPR